ncbi:hypothetical protein GKE82_05820 [Conexibacter sp. W3-3-2]|uniref:hypothetical protein n=1 Tax=Conexibacter sp. W3-3-2 TaxID=2675227 RepID=UPI0012B86B31|nr:hypothetical protein [Conexibacter sp. W3-3-2]MTD43833.1 hypothetical protein [Conexibacter sp. W3-3-2]
MERRGVPEQRRVVLMLEQGFFDRLRGLDGAELLEPLRDTRPLEYALQRLDRYALGGEGREGAGAEVAMRLIDGLASDLANGVRPPTGFPRHLGVLWPELHRLGFRWRAAARRRAAAERRAARVTDCGRPADAVAPC